MQSSYVDVCAHVYNIKILNIFYPEMQLLNTKPVIKNQLKSLLSEMEKFKLEIILV